MFCNLEDKFDRQIKIDIFIKRDGIEPSSEAADFIVGKGFGDLIEPRHIRKTNKEQFKQVAQLKRVVDEIRGLQRGRS